MLFYDEESVAMENKIKTFTLFVRKDEKSERIANNIRQSCRCSKKPLIETDDGDLIIAIGGDGTFLDSVNSTNFDKDKVYVGVHTGTLGFLLNLSESEIFPFIEQLSNKKVIKTRKVAVADITVNLKNGKKIKFKALNEVSIERKKNAKISFGEYVNGELLQNVSANGIIIATDTGDTAYSMNAGGAIDFSNHFQLECVLNVPIMNAAYPRFIPNPIICSEISIVSTTENNQISIVIDGQPKKISGKILSVDVNIDNSSYINKLELEPYSKVRVVREKILGYKD